MASISVHKMSAWLVLCLACLCWDQASGNNTTVSPVMGRVHLMPFGVMVKGTAAPCSFNMYTPDQYKFRDIGLDASIMSSFRFEFRGCHNAHVALTGSYGDFDEDTYKITIGDADGTQSLITSSIQGLESSGKTYTPTNAVTDCSEYRPFWISWTSARSTSKSNMQIVRAGTGQTVGQNQFMDLLVKQGFTIRNLAISTGFGSDGNWMVAGQCRDLPDCKADIGVVLDISKSITTPVYHDIMLPFVNGLMQRLNVHQAGVRVGVISFNDTVYPVFDLDEATSSEDAQSMLEHLEYNQGPTCVGCALESLSTRLFTQNYGDRSDVQNYGIFVSDGVSTVQRSLYRKQAKVLHQSGVDMVTVGVSGDEAVDERVMRNVATDPDHIYLVEDQDQMVTALLDIINHICPQAEDPCSTDPCRNGGTCLPSYDGTGFSCVCAVGFADDVCGTTCKSADIALVLDSSSSIKEQRWLNNVIPFAQEFAHHFILGPKDTQIGSVSFSKKSEVDFDLKEFTDSDDLDDALAMLNYHRSFTCIACGLREATDSIFAADRGDRADIPNYAVVFTDGMSNIDADKVQDEANRLKTEAGALVFVVAITNMVNMTEVEMIASQPASQFVLEVDNFGGLQRAAQDIATMSCGYTSAPTS